MAEIPNVPQLYRDVQYARMFLNAASREDDPERQRGLAAIGQGFAQLAQVEATWLGSAGTQVSQQAPESPGSPGSPGPPGDAEAARPTRRLDLRTAADATADHLLGDR